MAACGLLQTLEDGTIVQVNRTFCTWVGYEPGELIGLVRLQSLLAMGARIFHQTHWSPLLRMQGSVSEIKLSVNRRGGGTVPMVLNAIRREQDGVIVHEIATFVARDRDNYERELVRSRERLEELVAETTRLHAEAKERALFAEQMIAIVSHDLRNPLSTIVMGATLLRRDSLTAPQERSVVLIDRSARRASMLIGDLLDFASARLGGGLGVTPESVDLHQVVAHARDDLAALAVDRTIEHVAEGVGASTVDPHRLSQLVGNLVSNAIAYGAAGTPITVTSSVGSDGCTVTVHNHGAPIPAEAIATLFQPMTRGGSGDNSQRSIGLGLFIVQQIAQAHGGYVTVSSTASDGTAFCAAFPSPTAIP